MTAARIVVLSLCLMSLACERDVAPSGATVATSAKASSTAAPTAKKPRTVEGECGVAVDGGMHALALMRLTTEERAHDEIWKVGCFRGDCEIARLDAAALSSDGDVNRGQLTAWRGVSTQQGQVYEIKISGMADQSLTVDVGTKALRYRQTFKTGDVTTGVGSCASRTIGGAP